MTDDSSEGAKRYFSQNYNCAQSVAKSILEATGLNVEQITNIMAGFGAGIAHQGNVCGAVSGAIAALGVIMGETISDVQVHKEATYDISEKFVSIFEEQHASLLCDKLTSIEMRDIEQRNKAMKEGVFRTVCPNYVADAVKIALELTNK